MDIRVLYLEGCASWRAAAERLRQALALLGAPDTPINPVRVGFDEDGRNPVFCNGRRSCGEERVMTTMAPETEQPAGAASLAVVRCPLVA